jgi:aspartyl-tRNA synthetase
MLRDYKIDELSEKLAGKEVLLVGWVDTIREHGSVIFIDLRDRYGKVQTVVNKKNSEFEKIKEISKESCIQIRGEIKKRPKGTEKQGDCGRVEISINELKILSKAEQLPFDLKRKDVNEDTRLKYRYLDIRRPEMIKNLKLRHDAMKFVRDYLDQQGFLEIQTPILTKSSPEGARDYLVPSRVHPGKFYALPQAPQQYKQLLMVGGVDKYFQIAPCFRDEDARAHRSPGEFYQIDM